MSTQPFSLRFRPQSPPWGRPGHSLLCPFASWAWVACRLTEKHGSPRQPFSQRTLKAHPPCHGWRQEPGHGRRALPVLTAPLSRGTRTLTRRAVRGGRPQERAPWTGVRDEQGPQGHHQPQASELGSGSGSGHPWEGHGGTPFSPSRRGLSDLGSQRSQRSPEDQL